MFALILTLIIGTSMEPALHTLTSHELRPTPYSKLHRGLIVSYRNSFTHLMTAHRIVAGWSGWWVTQGDNSPEPDRGYCKPSNYIGQIIP